MGLPDPKQARDLLAQRREKERSEKRQARAKAVQLASEALEAEDAARVAIAKAIRAAGNGLYRVEIEPMPTATLRRLLRSRGFRVSTSKAPLNRLRYDDEPQLKKDTAFLLWDSPMNNIRRYSGRANGKTLYWLASSSGQEFLKELDISIKVASRLEEVSVRVTRNEIEPAGTSAPAFEELIDVMTVAGFEAQIVGNEFEISWDS
jgi:hypothetical protein